MRLPPLRERGADVLLLARHFIGELCRGLGIETKEMSAEFTDAIREYEWPGNVRELINVLQAALVQSLNDDLLYPQALPLELRLHHMQRSFGHSSPATASDPSKPLSTSSQAALIPYQQYRSQTEKRYLERLMAATRGRIPKACEISGLSRARIYQMLAKHGLKPAKSHK
jgi:two-component system, NtrC family, response regulator